MERRLAAIIAADLVGYTRLMGEDETGTLRCPGGLALHVCRAPRREGDQARQLGYLTRTGQKADRRAAAAGQVGRDPPRRRSPEAVTTARTAVFGTRAAASLSPQT